MHQNGMFLLPLVLAGVGLCSGSLVASSNNIGLILGHSTQLELRATSPLPKNVSLGYTYNNGKVVNVTIENVRLGPPWQIYLEGVALGHDIITFNITPNITDVSDAYVRVTVMRSEELALASSIVGWIYFVAWSISFYPQIYENWKRKSVVGLNFDFLSLNLVGFSLYSLFNCGLYWIPAVEEEYFAAHEKGLNPVQLNDIFFSLHALFATLITVIQCSIYERGGQTVSLVARIILGIFFLVILISLGLSLFTAQLSWLGFLSTCSYLKLVTTLIKYIPQAFMNFKRKSTVGWSIGNVLLDFTGGILSMVQMMVNADNYDDWGSIFGDPTKFGLGFFSVLFDIFFLVQHYILYRRTGYELIAGVDVPPEPEPPPSQPSGGGTKAQDQDAVSSPQVKEEPTTGDGLRRRSSASSSDSLAPDGTRADSATTQEATSDSPSPPTSPLSEAVQPSDGRKEGSDGVVV